MGASASVGQTERASRDGDADESKIIITESHRGSFDLPFGRGDLPATIPECGPSPTAVGLGGDAALSSSQLRGGLSVTYRDTGEPLVAPLAPPTPATPATPAAPFAAAAKAGQADFVPDEDRLRRRAFGSRKSAARIATRAAELPTPELPARQLGDVAITPAERAMEHLAMTAPLALLPTPELPARQLGDVAMTPAERAMEHLAMTAPLALKSTLPPATEAAAAKRLIVPFGRDGYLGEQRRHGFNSRESFDNFMKVDGALTLEHGDNTATPREPWLDIERSASLKPSPVGSFG